MIVTTPATLSAVADLERLRCSTAPAARRRTAGWIVSVPIQNAPMNRNSTTKPCSVSDLSTNWKGSTAYIMPNTAQTLSISSAG